MTAFGPVCPSVPIESFHILQSERAGELVFALPWCECERQELQFSGQGTNQDSETPSSVSSSAIGFLCNLIRCPSHPVPPFPNHGLYLFARLCFVLFFASVSWPRVMPVLSQADSALCTGPDIGWGGHMLWNRTAIAKRAVSDSSSSLELCSSPYPHRQTFFAGDSWYCKSNLRLETRFLMTFVSFTKTPEPRKEKNIDIKYYAPVSSARLLPSLSNTSAKHLRARAAPCARAPMPSLLRIWCCSLTFPCRLDLTNMISF